MRRTTAAIAAGAAIIVFAAPAVARATEVSPAGTPSPYARQEISKLRSIPVKGRAPKTGYSRAQFGPAWKDVDHNGCDTRNDILNRDLVDKTYVAIKRCPDAVATGILRDPYTNATIAFTRGNQVGAAVQIDHIVPLALAWDMGARDWSDAMRIRFANDPANLLAVAGQANQDKGDQEPATWMPPNHAFWCQYAMQFIAVARGYGLAVDQASAQELREAAATCPAA